MDKMMRVLVLFLAAIGAIVIWMLPPIAQDPAYHHLASQRGDVLASLLYLPIGVWGLLVSQKFKEGVARFLWSVFYLAVFFVGIGSFFYHLDPSNLRLAFDRFAMAIAFMALFSLILGNLFSWTFAKRAAPWLLGLGAFSVLYWAFQGDLRPYIWVQFVPFLALLLFSLDHQGKKRALLLGAWLSYLLAKLCESHDEAIYLGLYQTISGHTLKHLFSCLGVIALIFYVKASAREGGS